MLAGCIVLKADFMLVADPADLGVCRGDSPRMSSSGMVEGRCDPAPAWRGSSPSLGLISGPWKVATGPMPPRLFAPSNLSIPLQHDKLINTLARLAVSWAMYGVVFKAKMKHDAAAQTKHS